MRLEELLDLSALFTRAEGADRARNSRDALEDAERFSERVPDLLDEGPGCVLRGAAADEPTNQRCGVLCSHVGRYREPERPLHERRVSERGQRIEEAVVLLWFPRQPGQLRHVEVVEHRV